jgi:hypothetical protein
MRILAIDPGPVQSAWLVLADGVPAAFGIDDNDALRLSLIETSGDGYNRHDAYVIEEVESFGMAVGREVFRTVWWAGRFAEIIGGDDVVQMPRRRVKLAICHDSRAKDANIRTALIDRFGGPEVARGTKASPGPLYGISKDVWSALAIACTYHDEISERA